MRMEPLAAHSVRAPVMKYLEQLDAFELVASMSRARPVVVSERGAHYPPRAC